MKSKRLTGIIWYSLTIIYIMFAIVIVYLWAGEKILNANSQIKSIRQNYLNSQKNIIKTQVKQAVEYAYYQRSFAEKRARTEAKYRTYEAWEIASFIYNKNKDRFSNDHVQELIHDALYAASWNKSRGYYFVVSMSGIEIVNRNTPELEGQNVMEFRNSKGTYLTKEFIKAAKSPAQEGFVSYHYPAPDQPNVDVPKISFIKYFEPFDWFIGNGIYIIDEEAKIKEEVIERLQQIKYGSGGYLFGATWDGLSLLGPFMGENIFESSNSETKRLVQKMIRLAKTGGGFIKYLTPQFEENEPASKISYIEPIPEWQWYVGTGLHTDTIEATILEKQNEMKREMQTLVLKCIIVLGLFLVISFLIVRFISRKIEKNLNLFSSFFQISATQALPIEIDKVAFSEFKFLADSANQMSLKRIEAEEKREQLIQELKHALSEVKILSGLLPICASCKKVRDDQGYWNQMESYIQKHSDAKFSHGMCPECSDKIYGNEAWYIKMKKKKAIE